MSLYGRSRWEVFKEAKKQKKKEEIQREQTMSIHEKYMNLADALEKAALKSREVFSRSHVVTERAVRVGEFITILRRELQSSCLRYLADDLTRKNIWEDILVLSKRPGWRVGNNDIIISKAIAETLRRLDKIKTSIGIEQDLSSTENLLYESMTMLKESEDLVVKSNEVMQEFGDLVDKIEQEEQEYNNL